MTSNIAIKDLEISKELSGKALSDIRGGFNISEIGSQMQGVAGGGFLSPVTNVGVYAPTVTQIGDTTVNVNLSSLNNVLGNLAATVQQH
jgi:hypothetical protein